jgi:hypothetical protein
VTGTSGGAGPGTTTACRPSSWSTGSGRGGLLLLGVGAVQAVVWTALAFLIALHYEDRAAGLGAARSS